MSHENNPEGARRRFLTLVGSGLTAATITGLAGCSGDDAAPAATSQARPKADSTKMPEANTAVEEAAEATSANDMARLELDDPQAKALSYVHDATKTDAAMNPQYQAGQICANCVLYQGADEWGACAIFAGKAVNAKGWCNAYVAKPA